MFLAFSLDIPGSPAKIAGPPDGCKMTNKLGFTSAPPPSHPLGDPSAGDISNPDVT